MMSMLNQNLFEAADQDILMSSQVEILPNFLTNLISLPLGCSQSSDIVPVNNKTLETVLPPSSLLQSELPLPLQSHRYHNVQAKQIRDHRDLLPRLGAGSHLLSLQRSSPNYWAWGELSDCMSMKRNDEGGDGHDHHLGISAMKMKARRKVREPRFCFKTMSDVDVLDDGYKWRKYGQKVVKNTKHPRSYYRCTQDNCRVKKRVERLAEDPRMVITTYEGRHIHSPSHDEEHHLDSDQPNYAQLNYFFSL